VTIPGSVTVIGDYAFYGCESLSSVTIPGSVKSIGYCAFARCVNLASVTMLDGVEAIGTEAFLDCENLASVTIPSSVTSIGNGAFDGYYGFSDHVEEHVLTVEAGSYAEEFCKNNGFTYRYPDEAD
jgi:hypothetical protein